MEYPRRDGLYDRKVRGEQGGAAFSVGIAVFLAWLIAAYATSKKTETPDVLDQSKKIEKAEE